MLVNLKWSIGPYIAPFSLPLNIGNPGKLWAGVYSMTHIENFLRDESAATAIEYGLAAVLISIVALIGMNDTGQEVNDLYVNVEGAMASAAPGS
jgi:Flp pilus assembly pilin Flp